MKNRLFSKSAHCVTLYKKSVNNNHVKNSKIFKMYSRYSVSLTEEYLLY